MNFKKALKWIYNNLLSFENELKPKIKTNRRFKRVQELPCPSLLWCRWEHTCALLCSSGDLRMRVSQHGSVGLDQSLHASLVGMNVCSSFRIALLLHHCSFNGGSRKVRLRGARGGLVQSESRQYGDAKAHIPPHHNSKWYNPVLKAECTWSISFF